MLSLDELARAVEKAVSGELAIGKDCYAFAARNVAQRVLAEAAKFADRFEARPPGSYPCGICSREWTKAIRAFSESLR